jgi:K+-sensing histidine kinase KdpD
MMVLGFFCIIFSFQSLSPHSYILFLTPVILVSFLFDRGSGVYSSLLSACFLYFFYLDRPYRLLSAGELISLFTFLAISCLMALVIEALRVTVDELGDSIQALHEKNQLLKDFAQSKFKEKQQK